MVWKSGKLVWLKLFNCSITLVEMKICRHVPLNPCMAILVKRLFEGWVITVDWHAIAVVDRYLHYFVIEMLKLMVTYYVPSTDNSTLHFDFNPLSPFINVQILHTDLLTFLKDLIERI